MVRLHRFDIIRSYNNFQHFLQNENISQPANGYINNIIGYNEFKGKKMLIYFEDLLSEPVENLERIGKFLKIEKIQSR